MFIRTKHGILLTEEGNVFFKYIKTGIEAFQNDENAFLNYMNLDSGSIRIGASTTITRNIVMPYIEQFHKLHPNVDIKITNQLTSELITMLRKGDLDLLVVNLPMQKQKDVKIIPLCKVHDIFVANSHYYEKTKGKIMASDLAKFPLVTQKEPSNTRQFLNHYLEENQVSTKISNEIVSSSLVIDFVKAGFGIGYATKEFILDDLKKKKLYEIKVTPSIPTREVGIVLLDRSIPNYSALKLVEIMTQKQS